MTRAGVTLAISLAVGLVACQEVSDHSVHQFGGGPTVYTNYDLRPINDEGLAASVVVGFSTVETLQVTDDAPSANPVVAPAAVPPCDRMPVAIVPGDYDDDGMRDLWTQEACGGNWVSTGPGYAPGLPSTALVPTDPGP